MGKGLNQTHPDMNARSLAQKNPFDFDSRVTFDGTDHAYTVGDRPVKLSVTSVVKATFPASANFDGRCIAEKNLKKWRQNCSSRYHAVVVGIEDDEVAISTVLALWKANRDLGTVCHKAVELYLNGDKDGEDDEKGRTLVEGHRLADVDAELDQFVAWHSHKNDLGWKIRRTELALYYQHADGPALVAGTIDCLYEDDTGTTRVVDLKRTDKNLTRDAHNYGKYGTGHAGGLPDTDFYRYSLQCWLYSIMFEGLVGRPMGTPLLVQVHPDSSAATEVECADLRAVASEVLRSLSDH